MFRLSDTCINFSLVGIFVGILNMCSYLHIHYFFGVSGAQILIWSVTAQLNRSDVLNFTLEIAKATSPLFLKSLIITLCPGGVEAVLHRSSPDDGSVDEAERPDPVSEPELHRGGRDAD